MILLDTDVVVDLLRSHPPALHWLGSFTETETIAVSGFTALECVQGCRNREELRRLDDLLLEFDVLWLTPPGCEAALVRFRMDRLRHGAGAFDTLVAQTALEVEAPIHTFNAKHFRHVPGLEIRAPYDR